mmetsp:Transcript_9327/g.18410  ORF Transcript_9327/g.18410 Transcript_9327/m.18410 type:complete len:201 (+) Transcript_9327:319-921(+)
MSSYPRKHVVHILASFRRSFKVLETVLLSKSLDLLFINLTTFTITLVSNKSNGHIRIRALLLQALEPLLGLSKGLSVGQIEYNHSRFCTTVVKRSDGFVTLLPSGIPDLKNILLTLCLKFLRHVSCTNCWQLVIIEHALHKTHRQACLSNSHGSQNDELEAAFIVSKHLDLLCKSFLLLLFIMIFDYMSICILSPIRVGL